ncbi:hypothetical protein [Chroococcidiopsis sp. SAG 2025]|uniref:hypothetical protein n=1 Tax=Chroococcidiopsis sp. SAG 2025 TaxID=171389 RepID=UPI0029371048|nr:hypothetical protein [Chroococcidiopsis sp. SAG 2025]
MIVLTFSNQHRVAPDRIVESVRHQIDIVLDLKIGLQFRPDFTPVLPQLLIQKSPRIPKLFW